MNKKSHRVFNLVLCSIYLVASVLLIFRHEIWFDESHAWIVTRDVDGLGHLFQRQGYEGTPVLWHLLLYPFSRSGFPVITMQFIHLFIIFSAVVIFCWFSPFSKLHKGLFVFGYFMIFEYMAVSRNYGLSVLFIFLLAWFFKDRWRKPLRIGVVLFFLTQSNLHGIVIALAVLAALVFEFLFTFKKPQKAALKKNLLLTLGLSLAGVFIAAVQIIPPDNLMPALKDYQLGFSFISVKNVLRSVVGSFIPIPQFTRYFWDAETLLESISSYFLLLFLPLLASVFWLFRRHLTVLVMYFSAIVGLLLLFYVKPYSAFMRHYGQVFIFFIGCAWAILSEDKGEARENRSKKMLSIFLLAVLLFQLIGGIYAYIMDFRLPFTQSKKAAQFIMSQQLLDDETLLVGWKDFAVCPTLVYLPKLQYYYPQKRDFGSFINWTNDRMYDWDTGEVEDFARQSGYTRVVLVLNGIDRFDLSGYQKLAEFRYGINSNERYFIYQKWLR